LTLASPDSSPEPLGTKAFADSKFGSEAMVRLRAAFERSSNSMLLADDQRRWVTGNAAGCELLGIAREEIPWLTMDDFTPPAERRGLEERWDAFLATGAAEGWYELHLPNRGSMLVEFSATANVLPSRHLSVFIPPDQSTADVPGKASWEPVPVAEGGRLELSDREREVMTLVASGLQGGDIAERLFLSPETVKSHVHNVMGKLGAHTRAHAVAIALVTGQIAWDIDA
jgi:PAS domain S-box-containing protein